MGVLCASACVLVNEGACEVQGVRNGKKSIILSSEIPLIFRLYYHFVKKICAYIPLILSFCQEKRCLYFAYIRLYSAYISLIPRLYFAYISLIFRLYDQNCQEKSAISNTLVVGRIFGSNVDFFQSCLEDVSKLFEHCLWTSKAHTFV